MLELYKISYRTQNQIHILNILNKGVDSNQKENSVCLTFNLNSSLEILCRKEIQRLLLNNNFLLHSVWHGIPYKHY